jgi:hypothetical protein
MLNEINHEKKAWNTNTYSNNYIPGYRRNYLVASYELTGFWILFILDTIGKIWLYAYHIKAAKAQ